MYQIFYVSSISEKFSAEDIRRILGAAESYNSSHNISGILLYYGGIFLQLLEGDKATVEELFAKRILRDPRHKNIIQLLAVEGNERIFPDWTMAYHEVSELDLSMVNEILSWNRLIAGARSVDNELIFKMLRRFRERLTAA